MRILLRYARFCYGYVCWAEPFQRRSLLNAVVPTVKAEILPSQTVVATACVGGRRCACALAALCKEKHSDWEMRHWISKPLQSTSAHTRPADRTNARA